MLEYPVGACLRLKHTPEQAEAPRKVGLLLEMALSGCWCRTAAAALSVEALEI